MKLYIASDHAAFMQKSELVELLNQKHQLTDLGVDNDQSVHYPDYAIALCEKMIHAPEARGILLCGSGIGMSMVANRFQGIRAALCTSVEQARLSREHNDANVLCLGARLTPMKTLEQIVQMWLATDFAGGRHQQRVEKFNQLGEKIFRHTI